MPDTKVETIYETILKVRDDVAGSIDKDGKNEHHNYNYATHNNIVHHVRDACKKHKLLIIPMGLTDAFYAKSDTVVSGNFRYSLVNKDGDQTQAIIFAAGYDSLDKHAYKLDTGALKYLHIQLFMLATDLDPENPKHETKHETKQPTEADPLERIQNCGTTEELNKLWAVYPKWHDTHKDAFSKRKLELS